MKLLALDTSSIACTVAVQHDKKIVEKHEEQPREHTRILIPMIRSALDECGISPADLDAIVLGNGPGSFIGMRIAASVAQGIAYSSGVSIVPVSSMAAVAAEVIAEHAAAEVVVTQDAHMHETYLGIYRRDADGLPAEVVPERLCAQGPIAELGSEYGGRRIAAGAGWGRYPDLLAQNRDRIDVVSGVMYPRARFVLLLGEAALDKGAAVLPQQVSPAYLRQKVAEKPSPKP
jgi:tRNA threonylcarbamoyladenosine biosynthesis protein TsaB